MRTHKDLDVWKKSLEFVTEIYKVSKDFPKEEMYGITSQIRRSAVSIPSNISDIRKMTLGLKKFLNDK